MPTIPFPTDSRFLEEVREAVLQYARRRFGNSGLSLEDLTQEAMLVLFNNVQSGNLSELSCNLKTYAISILERVGLASLRKQSKVPSAPINVGDDDDDVVHPVDLAIARDAIQRWQDEEDSQAALMVQAMQQVIDKMMEPCKTILRLFYWENKKMKEIAEQMKYKSDDVAKTKKSHCMTKVKAAMEETLKRMRS